MGVTWGEEGNEAEGAEGGIRKGGRVTLGVTCGEKGTAEDGIRKGHLRDDLEAGEEKQGGNRGGITLRDE